MMYCVIIIKFMGTLLWRRQFAFFKLERQLLRQVCITSHSYRAFFINPACFTSQTTNLVQFPDRQSSTAGGGTKEHDCATILSSRIPFSAERIGRRFFV
jgi:hypothetical protein